MAFSPKHALANYRLGAVLLADGKTEQAEDSLRRSLAAQPTACAWNDLAEALRRQRKTEAAIQAAREAVRLNPRSWQAFDTLGWTRTIPRCPPPCKRNASPSGRTCGEPGDRCDLRCSRFSTNSNRTLHSRTTRPTRVNTRQVVIGAGPRMWRRAAA